MVLDQVTSCFLISNSENLVSAPGRWLIKYCKSLPERQLWHTVASYAAQSDTAALSLPQGKSWISCIITQEIDLHIKTDSHSGETVKWSIHLTKNYWWNMYHYPLMYFKAAAAAALGKMWDQPFWQHGSDARCLLNHEWWLKSDVQLQWVVTPCGYKQTLHRNPVSLISPRNTDPVSLASSSPPPFENILLHSWKMNDQSI